MSPIEHNRAIVREFTRIFKNQHHVDDVDHLFHNTFEHHFAPPVRPGLNGFKDVGRMMNQALPDVAVREEDLIVTDNMVVERSSAEATHKGAMMGVAATDRRVRWTEIHIYRVTDGKISAHWVELSMLQLLQQIGAAPQSAA